MTRNIFVLNADLPLTDALCLDLLMCPPHRQNVGKVWATVRDLERAGALAVSGAFLIQMGDSPEEEHLTEYLKQVDCVVLAPDWTSEMMVQQAELIIRCCRKANVKQLILHSRVGIEDAPGNKTAEKYRKIENSVHESKLQEVSIIRSVPVHQDLFMFRRNMLQNGKLQWNVKPDAKFTLVNFIDEVAFFRSEIIGNQQARRQGDVQIYRLTGTSLLTAQDLCHTFKQQAGIEVKYEQVDRNRLNQYLTKELGLNDMVAEGVLDGFELINIGRLNKVSDDMKKKIDRQPEKLEHFIKDHAGQFSF